MKITAALAVELELLTQALDLPDTDVAESLIRLGADAQSAIDSYLGLSVAISVGHSQFDLTVLDEGVQQDHVRTSLLVPLSPEILDGAAPPPSVVLILYAAAPGALVDLAADLAWITGRNAADFRLDEHRTPPPNSADQSRLTSLSTINQAVGVLIGRGFTPEQAGRDMYARAAEAGIDLLAVATLILATLGGANAGSARP